MNPLVSVVMSVYNGEKYLRESVESILNQTFTDFEFIIINDGSTDKTKNILEEYAAKDKRVILIHQDNVGLTKSLNNGIALAKGKYIARQDAGDLSVRERLYHQIGFLEAHRNIAAVGTAFTIIDEDGYCLQNIVYPGEHAAIKEALKQYNCLCHGSAMFRHTLFSELGGYRELFVTSQDYDLWLRAAECFQLANLPIFLYEYRFSSNSITFKKLVSQKRMATFARQLAQTREVHGNEESLLRNIKTFLGSPLSFQEKREIIRDYSFWGRLLLSHRKNREAFLIMAGAFRYHPSRLYKFIFNLTKGFRSSYILERLLKYE